MQPEKHLMSSGFKILSAKKENLKLIEKFLQKNIRIHRHLDWFSTLDWLGDQSFLLAVDDNNILAILCATLENKSVAWVRTFGLKKSLPIFEIWDRMLPMVIMQLETAETKQLEALAFHHWFETLLIRSRFTHHQTIIVLEWQGRKMPSKNANSHIQIRQMTATDLPEVRQLDQLAFAPIWQNSLATLSKAFHHTGISTVAIYENEIIGYQISTLIGNYGHLARLAVHPAHQRQGIGVTLIQDLIHRFEKLGCLHFTVNTQSDNDKSLKLYQKLGFSQSQKKIPVYTLDL